MEQQQRRTRDQGVCQAPPCHRRSLDAKRNRRIPYPLKCLSNVQVLRLGFLEVSPFRRNGCGYLCLEPTKPNQPAGENRPPRETKQRQTVLTSTRFFWRCP